MTRVKKRSSVLPGFGLSMGFTILYLSLIILIPLSAVFLKTAGQSWGSFWATVSHPRVVASYELSIYASFIAAAINGVFGFLVAWVLVRYRFPGKRVIDGIIDIPFALPTAVAGIALTTIYAKNGWVGSFLHDMGIKSAYSPLGIIIALTFIGLPFVVRTLQPVLEELEKDTEEASAILGAGRFRTFRKVIFPELLPPLITGFALAFARSLGEYGSVVFISGNMPMKTEITPLLIMTKLEQFDYVGATSIAMVMLLLSFTLLLLINLVQWKTNQKMLPR